MSELFSRKMTFTLNEKDQRNVRILFICRIILWCIAFAGFVYWAYWSFELYHEGIWDEHDYATILRPILAKGMLISIVSIVISLILRKISDMIKYRAEQEILAGETALVNPELLAKEENRTATGAKPNKYSKTKKLQMKD